MKEINYFKDGKIKKVDSNYFTGNTRLSELSDILKAKESKIYHVKFPNGARTKLHYHTGGQLLIVTKGKGSLELFKKNGKGISAFKIQKKEKIKLKLGSIAYIEPKVLHTHGSVKKDEIFSHIAINFYPSRNAEPKTTWFESDFKQNVTRKLQ